MPVVCLVDSVGWVDVVNPTISHNQRARFRAALAVRGLGPGRLICTLFAGRGGKPLARGERGR